MLVHLQNAHSHCIGEYILSPNHNRNGECQAYEPNTVATKLFQNASHAHVMVLLHAHAHGQRIGTLSCNIFFAERQTNSTNRQHKQRPCGFTKSIT